MAKQKTTIKPKAIIEQQIADEQFRKIRKWNLWAGLVLLAQALAIAIIGTGKIVPVTTSYLAIDPMASQPKGEQILAVATRHIFDVRIAWITALFLIIFAAVFFAAATVYRKRYEARLQAGMNDLRWFGLGLGGAVMVVVVALLSGLHELTGLFMLAASVVAGSVAVLCAEEVARREQKKALLSHVICGVGTLGLAVPLIVLAKLAGGAVLYDGVIPAYVWGILGSILGMFILGFLLAHFRIKRRGWMKDTVRAECLFMLLIFIAASALAWQIFVGTLQP